MKLYSIFKVLFICFLLQVSDAFAKSDPLVFNSGKLEITLQDHLHHPYYWWPSTLLNYPVLFDKEPLPEQYVLTDQSTGVLVPFQISGIEKQEDGKFLVTLSFISDLPSGAKKTYTLQKSSPVMNFPPVQVIESAEYITIQTDKLGVRLPASQGSSALCPGPVVGLTDRQGKWTGISKLETSGKKLNSITTRAVSVGPLFAEYNVRYSFEGGAGYDVYIKCINGYDFFEVKEKMNGFSEADSASWEINWNGFSPTHIQGSPWHAFATKSLTKTDNPGITDNPGFGRYDWEPIDQVLYPVSHGVIDYSNMNGRIFFEVDVFENNDQKRLPSTLFWDEKSMQSFGVFMNDASWWNDHLYPIWNVSGKLSVVFYYRDKQLLWRYPINNGTRSTAISCYDHAKDIAFMDGLEKLSQPQTHPSGFTYNAQMSPKSHNSYLQNWYGTLHLDKIKGWILTYPDSLPLRPVIFQGNNESIKMLEQTFLYNKGFLEIPVSGWRTLIGFWEYGEALNRLLPSMTEQDRERFVSMFLFCTYLAAGEEWMPMRNMLSGHPNFMAHLKITLGMAAFLFPGHPEAKNWEEGFGKFIDLNYRYHTRPEVTAWDAKGGRWTENLGGYAWVSLAEAANANFLIKNYGSGRNFLAGKNQARQGSWFLNSLSAPFNGESFDFYRIYGEARGGIVHPRFSGVLTKEEGPRRVYPPQGAHAFRRLPPPYLWKLGDDLQNYDPLLGENLRYVSRPNDPYYPKNPPTFELMFPKKDFDTGTPPDFKTVKFTGYGTILRAGVGTGEELSIHLSQIDRGPNYRWGVSAQGGTGTIYFYAGGKSYTHHGMYDVGDRMLQDTDLHTNFGIFKAGSFKSPGPNVFTSIGQNVLSKPLYDLEVGQFTEIICAKESYSWPEYQSRSIMLVGTDYFIVYDDVYNQKINSRFSWFTHPEEDFPDIQIIKALGTLGKAGGPAKTEITGRESKGLWYDGSGDFMVFISHKKGFQTKLMEYGAVIETPAGAKDFIFRNDIPVIVDEPGMIFTGLAGFIRQKKDGANEMAIFHGTKIGDEKFVIETRNPDAGISAVVESEGSIEGRYYSFEPSQVTLRWRKARPVKINFYLDGLKQTVRDTEDGITVNIPSGTHIWNIGSFPCPPRPEINFTRNEKGKVLFTIRPVSGASGYRFEYSTDAGKNWSLLKEQSKTALWIKPKSSETKGFVRVIALNEEHTGKASVIYPVYYTFERPHYPDGLKLNIISSNEVELSWGNVLGCNVYRLYRRPRGNNEKYGLIYEGSANQFRDNTIQGKGIFEYAVSSVNGNGEGKLCYPVTNDPDSWLNFDPMPGEPFKRTNNFYDGTRDYSGDPVNLHYPR